ncbi:DUF2752 domain-containing protein [Cellulomonas sp. APG4]|nr:DUF2752 domain-containing protein [Cellulomonas sp. APG4]NCT89826.1 DUF2752 domain-containing protein [Cellulomonas sp. APG4]
MSGALVAGATAVLAVRSPYQDGSYGWCPVVAVTGAWCPACGGLRAVHDLTQGDVVSAWGMNAPVVALLPFVALGWAMWLVAALRRRPVPAWAPTWVAWALLAGALVFTVLRNVPALAPFLAPGGAPPPFLG